MVACIAVKHHTWSPYFNCFIVQGNYVSVFESISQSIYIIALISSKTFSQFFFSLDFWLLLFHKKKIRSWCPVWLCPTETKNITNTNILYFWPLWLMCILPHYYLVWKFVNMTVRKLIFVFVQKGKMRDHKILPKALYWLIILLHLWAFLSLLSVYYTSLPVCSRGVLSIALPWGSWYNSF